MTVSIWSRWITAQEFGQLVYELGIWPTRYVDNLLQELERERLLVPVARLYLPMGHAEGSEWHPPSDKVLQLSGDTAFKQRLYDMRNPHLNGKFVRHPLDEPDAAWQALMETNLADKPFVAWDELPLILPLLGGQSNSVPVNFQILYHGWQAFSLAPLIERRYSVRCTSCTSKHTELGKSLFDRADSRDLLEMISCFQAVSWFKFYEQYLTIFITEKFGQNLDAFNASERDGRFIELAKKAASIYNTSVNDLENFIRFQDNQQRHMLDHEAHKLQQACVKNISSSINLLCDIDNRAFSDVVDTLNQEPLDLQPSLRRLFPRWEDKVSSQTRSFFEAEAKDTPYGGHAVPGLVIDMKAVDRFIAWLLREGFLPFFAHLNHIQKPVLRYTDVGRSTLAVTAVGLGAMLEHLVAKMLRSAGYKLPNFLGPRLEEAWKNNRITKKFMNSNNGYTRTGNKNFPYQWNAIESIATNTQEERVGSLMLKATLCRNDGTHNGFEGLTAPELVRIIKVHLLAALFCFSELEARMQAPISSTTCP